MNSLSTLTQLHISLQRLVRWEFWPWQVVYIPVAVYWFFLAIKARGWVFFSAANPCMRFGGLVAYSKSDMGDLVPDAYQIKTLSFKSKSSAEKVLSEIAASNLGFPLVIKPDMGERGRGVDIVNSDVELQQRISRMQGDFLIQPYVDCSEEYGIMYSRHPNEQFGKITSVVVKDFPFLIGDGKSTLQQLILGNLRTRLNYKVHFKRFEAELQSVLPVGERKQMVTIGNHMLGTTFYNGNHLITDELELVFDKLSKQIPGFFIGRYDIKAESVEEVLKGNFKVIEVNGVNSEPCHIFDPKMPLLIALRDLIKHWKRIYEISVANHKNGVPYASISEIVSEIKRHSQVGAIHP